MESETIIVTDGASKGNPGPGGWGAIVVSGNAVVEIGGREESTTNNQMELRAAVEGLRLAIAQKAQDIRFYSDSSYVLNGISKWVHAWEKNGWQTSTKQAVLNMPLWKELAALAHDPNLSITWNYVSGHSGIAGNERADQIASGFASGMQPRLFAGPLADYGVDVLNFEMDEEKKKIKAASRVRSKAAAYSYVSEVDGVVLVHKTWAECEARVKGKKARYKKVLSSAEEAEIVKLFGLKKP